MSSCRVRVDGTRIACRNWAARATARCDKWTAKWSQRSSRWAQQGGARVAAWNDERQLHCHSKADQRWYAHSNWTLSSRLSHALVSLSTWLASVCYLAASCVARSSYWLADRLSQAAVRIVRYGALTLFWSVRTFAVLFSWLGHLVCALWDNLRCVWLQAFDSRRRHARKIKHVFVLVLENRSFDHMLGLAGLEGIDAVTGKPTKADDLVGNPHFNIDPVRPEGLVFATSPAEYQFFAPDVCPGHEFHDTLTQLCGANAVYPDPGTGGYPPIDNSGFVASYRAIGAPAPAKIMCCYSPEQVPVLTTLAREFALCDRWFSSVPGPTWPNRFFIHAASSAGLDDSPSHFEVATAALVEGYHFKKGTIYDRLDDRCLDWMVFMGDQLPQVFAISGMSAARLQGRFHDFYEFAAIVNDPDFSTSYIFIEPDYGNVLPTTPRDFTGGNSQHPLDDIVAGERLIKQVYETIRNSPHWHESLLVITHDEHGGFFDHVTPPTTVSPGDKTTAPENNHHGFEFTQLGVRVPAVVISPFIPRGTIDHTVYDHASLLATVEKMYGLKPLTRRDREANTFNHLLALETPRTDTPATLPDVADSSPARKDNSRGASSPREVPETANPNSTSDHIEPMLRGFLHFSFLIDYKLAPTPAKKALMRKFLKISNRPDALRYMEEVASRVRTRMRKRKPRSARDAIK